MIFIILLQWDLEAVLQSIRDVVFVYLSIPELVELKYYINFFNLNFSKLE